MNKRFIALFLILLMVVGMLSGCSKDTPQPDPVPPLDNTTEDNKPQNDPTLPTEYVYHASFSPISDELIDSYSIDTISSFCVSGKTVFFSAMCLDPDASTEPYYDPVTDEMFEGEAAYKTMFFAIDPDTMTVTPLRYEPTQMKEGREGTCLLSEVCPGNDGTVWIIETIESYYYDLPADFDQENDTMWNYYKADDPTITLLHFDAAGSLLSSSSVYYPSSAGELYTLVADVYGNVYASTANAVYLYDSTGSLLNELEVTDGSLQNFGTKGVGHVSYAGGSREIRMIDPEEGTFHDSITISNSAWTLGQGSGAYDCTFVQNGVIFAVNAAANNTVPLLDWLSCDLDASNILKYAITDEEEILALANEDGQYGLVHVKLVDAATLPVRQEMVLGTAYLSNDLRAAIVQFNTSQEALKIRVKDYSLDSMSVDGLYGAEALLKDISKGIVPDLLLTDDLPVNYLAGKGLLVDLNPLIDSDPELSGDALMTHLFNTAEIDGKLYEVSSRFTISTAVSSAETNASSKWTFGAASDALNTMSDGATILGTSSALKQMIAAYLRNDDNGFIDWSTMTCSYDGSEFLEFLQFVNTISEQINQITGKKESEYKKIFSNKQLLSLHSVDELIDMTYINALHRNNVLHFGYPAKDGAENYFQLENPIAITTACTDSSAAWEFVRMFLTDAYQTAEQGIGIPTNKTTFDAYTATMMMPEYTTDSDGNRVEVSRGSVKLDDIISIPLYAVSEKEFAMFNDLYTMCNHMGRSNQTLINLISTEITAMLNGRSAEDTAAAVQTVVEEYLNQLK